MTLPADRTLLRGEIGLPFHLLALSVLLVLGGLVSNRLRQGEALERQLIEVQAQGQQASGVRLHYFGLFSELAELADTNDDARRIVDAFGIQFTPPEVMDENPAATEGASE